MVNQPLTKQAVEQAIIALACGFETAQNSPRFARFVVLKSSYPHTVHYILWQEIVNTLVLDARRSPVIVFELAEGRC